MSLAAPFSSDNLTKLVASLRVFLSSGAFGAFTVMIRVALAESLLTVSVASIEIFFAPAVTFENILAFPCHLAFLLTEILTAKSCT